VSKPYRFTSRPEALWWLNGNWLAIWWCGADEFDDASPFYA
jgi:hypothetical protein